MTLSYQPADKALKDYEMRCFERIFSFSFLDFIFGNAIDFNHITYHLNEIKNSVLAPNVSVGGVTR